MYGEITKTARIRTDGRDWKRPGTSAIHTDLGSTRCVIENRSVRPQRNGGIWTPKLIQMNDQAFILEERGQVSRVRSVERTSDPVHELAISESIIGLVVDCARRERITRVSRVVVEIGVAASVDPEALLFCFPIAAAETVAAGAELVINRIALRVRCESCQTEYAPDTPVAACPACGGLAREILAGREMRVVSFDGE